MKAFKAYDIRGVYNKDFTKDDVYKIGFFLPALLNCRTVLIGRDVRASSEEIFTYLCRGINDAGKDVVSLGLTTTPMVYYATAKYGYDASVQITASHNPPEYNGLKISRTGALPVGGDSGLKDLERMVEHDKLTPVDASERGSISEFDAVPDYLAFMNAYLPDVSDLNLSVDCSNGMAVLLIKKLLGDSPHYLYDTLDGTFPNHEPNPLVEENVADLKRAVLENRSDLGVIFDGDADRVMFVDEKGRFIQPDIITAVLGKSILEGHFSENQSGDAFGTGKADAEASAQRPIVLQDIRTSKSTAEYLESLGASVYTWKVGHAYAKLKMRELNAVFGGELAGHYYFRDFYNCDSGILASLMVIKAAAELKKEGRTFSSLIDSIVSYAGSGETNFHIEQKSEAMEALKDHFLSSDKEKPEKFMDFDGYRIEFSDWWFNVRPSNTEPYLRLVVEAKTKTLLKEKFDEITAVIRKFN